MKPSFKIILVVLVCVVCIYSACKKGAVTPTATTTNTAAISKQIALSLYKSISGNYGGANISDGIKAPSNTAASKKGPRINDVNPYCGYTVDTTLNFTVPVGDTMKTVNSHFKFIYTCSASTLDGYILSDSITYTDKGSLFLNKYVTAQNYTVNKSGSGVVLMQGAISSSIHFSTLNTSHVTTAYNYTESQYVLNGVTVDISSGAANVTAGTATFNTALTYLDPTASANVVSGGYTGTITFQGHYMAKIALLYNGQTSNYMINMLTGETTPI